MFDSAIERVLNVSVRYDTALRNTPLYLVEETVAENRVSMNEICPAISGALLRHTDDVQQRTPTLWAVVFHNYTWCGSYLSLLPP